MSFGTGKIWMNGSLVEWADARMHIGSHVIHYGSGVFEGARCYATPRGSASFRIDDHIERLMNSAREFEDIIKRFLDWRESRFARSEELLLDEAEPSIF